jgi:hypothetical protein
MRFLVVGVCIGCFLALAISGCATLQEDAVKMSYNSPYNDWDGDGIRDTKDKDDDNDGYSDAEEKEAGTDPFDYFDHPEK